MKSRSNKLRKLAVLCSATVILFTADIRDVLCRQSSPPSSLSLSRSVDAFLTTSPPRTRTSTSNNSPLLVVLFQSSNVKIRGKDLPVSLTSPSSRKDVKATTRTTTKTARPIPSLNDYLSKSQRSSSSSSPLSNDDDLLDEEYKKGFAIIAFITLLNASLAPVWHTVFDGTKAPPPLFLNAVVSIVAFTGLLLGSPFLDSKVGTMSALASSNSDGGDNTEKWSAQSFRGGVELGLWKGLGTTCHIYGMALTTANHGAFLLQLTTLIVPILQGIRGERIPKQIQLAVALALAGIVAFTQDPSGAAGASDVTSDPTQVQIGDALVLGAAFFYSLYDIQTFYWGREVPRTELVTIKVGFQAVLSVILCAAVARDDVVLYMRAGPDWSVLVPTVLWSGLIVNALATFLQVGGMQSVGPTRAQTIFASQPLWASILNFAFIGEIVGLQGLVGGGAFLGALFLAATAETPQHIPSSSEAATANETAP